MLKVCLLQQVQLFNVARLNCLSLQKLHYI